MTEFKEILPHEVEGSPVDPVERTKTIISSSRVVLFMKGNSSMPRCGFSANAIKLLDKHQATANTYDILKDPEVRQAIKEYSNWPTFPQLYVHGKLVGGNDIITELDENNQLTQVLND